MEELINDFESQEWLRKKRYLARYKKNLALIDRLKNKIDLLDERSEKIKSPNYSGMPRGGTPVTSYDMKEEKADLEARIERLKIKGAIYKKEILETIDELEDPRYADVLEYFFIERLELSDIAEEMDYSLRHIKALYSDGIKAISLP